MSTSSPTPAPVTPAVISAPSRSSLARKGLPILIATLFSRPLGFVREAVQAALFGASRLTDAFLVAYNVPEMIQTLFFSGVLSNFFVPVITRYREQQEELMAVIKGTLNSLDHYAMPEYAGVFFNVVVIASALLLASSYGITSLALGVVGGSVVQVLVQVPMLVRKGIRYRPTLMFAHPALREMGGLVIGAVVATAVVPINAAVDRAMASGLPAGSISALAYAFRVFLLPVSLVAVPVYTVLLTDLSAAHHQGKPQVFKDQATAGLSLLFAVALPATAVLVALATPITRLLYERGQFTAADTVRTSQALAAFAVGTLAYGTSQVMVRLFNATKDTRTPAWVGVGSIALNAGGGWLLMRIWGHWGIALVTSIVSYLNTVVLYAIFRHRCGPLDEPLLTRRFVAHLLLATALGVILFIFGRPLAVASGSIMTFMRLFQFAGILAIGGSTYLLLGLLFKVDEVMTLKRKVVQWLSRRQPV